MSTKAKIKSGVTDLSQSKTAKKPNKTGAKYRDCDLALAQAVRAMPARVVDYVCSNIETILPHVPETRRLNEGCCIDGQGALQALVAIASVLDFTQVVRLRHAVVDAIVDGTLSRDGADCESLRLVGKHTIRTSLLGKEEIPLDDRLLPETIDALPKAVQSAVKELMKLAPDQQLVADQSIRDAFAPKADISGSYGGFLGPRDDDDDAIRTAWAWMQHGPAGSIIVIIDGRWFRLEGYLAEQVRKVTAE